MEYVINKQVIIWQMFMWSMINSSHLTNLKWTFHNFNYCKQVGRDICFRKILNFMRLRSPFPKTVSFKRLVTGGGGGLHTSSRKCHLNLNVFLNELFEHSCVAYRNCQQKIVCLQLSCSYSGWGLAYVYNNT